MTAATTHAAARQTASNTPTRGTRRVYRWALLTDCGRMLFVVVGLRSPLRLELPHAIPPCPPDPDPRRRARGRPPPRATAGGRRARPRHRRGRQPDLRRLVRRPGRRRLREHLLGLPDHVEVLRRTA